MASSDNAQDKYEAWLADQVAKSEFFRQKLHEYGLLQVAYAIEQVQGEDLNWNQQDLCISEKAWNRVIHRGIKPILVFAHPYILSTIRRSVGYYQKLAMVSLKSMNNIGLSITRYESGQNKHPLPDPKAQVVACRLNELISRLIEEDEQIGSRKFDLWRGMTAGSTAQGSWQNRKGDIVEDIVKDFVRRRIHARKLLADESDDGAKVMLIDGRGIEYGSEPDIAFYSANHEILAAVEIKGGIDTAGVLERVGAAIKSLSRAKTENPDAMTVLVMYRVAMTDQAQHDLESHKNDIDHWFTIEDVLNHADKREELFKLLDI